MVVENGCSWNMHVPGHAGVSVISDNNTASTVTGRQKSPENDRTSCVNVEAITSVLNVLWGLKCNWYCCAVERGKCDSHKNSDP